MRNGSLAKFPTECAKLPRREAALRLALALTTTRWCGPSQSFPAIPRLHAPPLGACASLHTACSNSPLPAHVLHGIHALAHPRRGARP